MFPTKILQLNMMLNGQLSLSRLSEVREAALSSTALTSNNTVSDAAAADNDDDDNDDDDDGSLPRRRQRMSPGVPSFSCNSILATVTALNTIINES